MLSSLHIHRLGDTASFARCEMLCYHTDRASGLASAIAKYVIYRAKMRTRKGRALTRGTFSWRLPTGAAAPISRH